MEEEIGRHLDSAAQSRTPAGRSARVRLFGTCWPGGGVDVFNAAAAIWLARWRPQKLGAALPDCTCRTGHCAICN